MGRESRLMSPVWPWGPLHRDDPPQLEQAEEHQQSSECVSGDWHYKERSLEKLLTSFSLCVHNRSFEIGRLRVENGSSALNWPDHVNEAKGSGGFTLSQNLDSPRISESICLLGLSSENKLSQTGCSKQWWGTNHLPILEAWGPGSRCHQDWFPCDLSPWVAGGTCSVSLASVHTEALWFCLSL